MNKQRQIASKGGKARHRSIL
ncbi:MAG: hypothetical protein HY428_02405 [Candidatus Levybacteria bacterium]|nr:hypothetical protein [Candidatus Levybacteria bacterium]